MENEKKILITIGRQSGSAGRRIGFAVGEKLGIPCYDREIISEAAKTHGYAEEFIERHDEKQASSFLYSIAMGARSPLQQGSVSLPLEQKVFLAQYNTIKELANQGSGIFIGRCSDYALENYEGVTKIFICCDEDDAVEHIKVSYNLTLDKARDYIRKKNKKRANYYNYYTGRKWGDAKNYDLCINKSRLGIEGSVNLILNYLKCRDEKKDD